MNTHADKASNRRQAFVNVLQKQQDSNQSSSEFVDNRPEAIAQRKLPATVNNNPKVQQLKALQGIANSSPQSIQMQQLQIVQRNKGESEKKYDQIPKEGESKWDSSGSDKKKEKIWEEMKKQEFIENTKDLLGASDDPQKGPTTNHILNKADLPQFEFKREIYG